MQDEKHDCGGFRCGGCGMQDDEAVVVVVQTYAAVVLVVAVVVVVVVVDMVAEETMPGGLLGYRKWRSPATPPEQNTRVPEIQNPPYPYIYIYILYPCMYCI